MTTVSARSEKPLKPARTQAATRRVMRNERVEKELRGVIVLVLVLFWC
jgi:hypothetical protein